MFASLKAQAYDTRLAAVVELYGIAKSAVSAPWFAADGARRASPNEMRRFNRELQEWQAYWEPELEDAVRRGDFMAPVAVSMYGQLVRSIVNAW